MLRAAESLLSSPSLSLSFFLTHKHTHTESNVGVSVQFMYRSSVGYEREVVFLLDGVRMYVFMENVYGKAMLCVDQNRET